MNDKKLRRNSDTQIPSSSQPTSSSTSSSTSSPSASQMYTTNDNSNQSPYRGSNHMMIKGVLKKPTVSIINENETMNENERIYNMKTNSNGNNNNNGRIQQSTDILYVNVPLRSMPPMQDNNNKQHEHELYIINGTNRQQGPSTNTGHLNNGYLGSQPSLQQNGGSTASIQVIREQYWSWSCPFLRCQNWTKREKILFTILAILSCIIVGLVIVISVIAGDKHELSPDWLPWTL